MTSSSNASDSSTHLQHLLSLDDLSAEQITTILDQAQAFIPPSSPQKIEKLDYLLGSSVFNLFFEPSTRTLTTFAIAATRLSADVQSLNIARSSQSKGESILDTVATLSAMGADYFIIRHSQSGACDFVAQFVGNSIHVVNAGDGSHAHPTQGLLDLYTIRHYLPAFPHLSVVIVGDVLHSRVARSQIGGLQKLGVQDIRVVCPATLQPEEIHTWGVSVDYNFDRALDGVDVIMMLRLQNERMSAALIPSSEEYFHFYGLTPERLQRAKPNALVMHPGPINRQVEIDARIADGPQSVILSQVTFGIAVRMAVLSIMNHMGSNT